MNTFNNQKKKKNKFKNLLKNYKNKLYKIIIKKW